MHQSPFHCAPPFYHRKPAGGAAPEPPPPFDIETRSKTLFLIARSASRFYKTGACAFQMKLFHLKSGSKRQLNALIPIYFILARFCPKRKFFYFPPFSLQKPGILRISERRGGFPMRLLNEKIALVTSATRGIGLACTEKLAEHGAKVYLAVRRPEAGQDICRRIRDSGGQADVVYFDATEEDTCRTMIEEVLSKEGRLDILVNNYGHTDVKKDFDLVTGDTEAFFHILDLNLKSVYLPCKYAVPSMVKTGGGSIVNIASVGGRYPDMSRLAYGVSKAAILFLTKNIAVQYARQGVRCNAILPGFIATDAAMNNMSKEYLDVFLKTVPLNRPGQPEDISNACLFLASDMSAFVTGEELAVAGGFGLPSPMYSHYGEMQGKG